MLCRQVWEILPYCVAPKNKTKQTKTEAFIIWHRGSNPDMKPHYMASDFVDTLYQQRYNAWVSRFLCSILYDDKKTSAHLTDENQAWDPY